MEDSNKTLPSQSPPPNSTSPGNEENMSESHRNSQKKSKNFMSTTVSAASKAISPKNRILSEWKSPENLDPKSPAHKSGNSKKTLPKIPSCSSPVYAVQSEKNSGEMDGEFTFLGDDSDVHYDPLNNYLFPRPKFLRYRPNRKREILGERGVNNGVGLKDSIESLGYCSVESSLNQENGVEDEICVVNEEKMSQDEDVIEERNACGLKRVLLRFFVVFSALFVIIASMSLVNVPVTPRCEKGSVSVEHQDVVDMGFKFVSLRSLGSKIGMVGLNTSRFFKGADLGKIDVFEDPYEKYDYLDEYNSLQSRFRDQEYPDEEQDEYDVVNDPESPVQTFDDENVVPDSVSKEQKVEIEAPMAASGPSEVTGMGNVAVSEGRTFDDKDGVPEYLRVEIEAPMAASEPTDVTDTGNVAVSDAKINGSEANPRGRELRAEPEKVKGTSAENSGAKSGEREVVADQESSVSESKFDDSDRANPAEDYIEGSLENIEFENEVGQLRLTTWDRYWIVIPSVLGLGVLVFFVLKFYWRCKRASSRTRSSNAMLPRGGPGGGGKLPKSRLGLPAKQDQRGKTVEDIELGHPVQKTSTELNPPSVDRPHASFDNTASRMVPKVKQLGEFDVGADFRRPGSSSSTKSDVQEKDETAYFTPADKTLRPRPSALGRATPVKSSVSGFSGSEPGSHGSQLSQGGTSNKDGNEAVAAIPRRSERIRNKGL